MEWRDRHLLAVVEREERDVLAGVRACFDGAWIEDEVVGNRGSATEIDVAEFHGPAGVGDDAADRVGIDPPP